MEELDSLPLLTAEELRILGALIEKSRTTPEYYPLTINALQTACNQKTARKPVVQYTESILAVALDTLRKKGLVSTVVGGGSRTVKYKHNLAIQYPLLPQELAVLCLLILRGPLTPGEINSSSGRLYTFDSLEEVQYLLHKLANQTPAFVRALSKRSGQKEIRFVHLLGDVDEDAYETATDVSAASSGGETVKELEGRVAQLEERLDSLQSAFDELMKQLT